MAAGRFGPCRDLQHPSQFSAPLCNLCQGIQSDTAACLCRLYPRLLRYGSQRQCHRLWHRLLLHSLGWHSLVRATDHLRSGMQHCLDPLDRLGVQFRFRNRLGLGEWLVLSPITLVGSLLLRQRLLWPSSCLGPGRVGIYNGQLLPPGLLCAVRLSPLPVAGRVWKCVQLTTRHSRCRPEKIRTKCVQK